MGIFQNSMPASQTPTTTPRRSSAFWPLFASSFLLSALSATELALISSMVAWLHKQEDAVHSYQVDWPGNTTPLNVLPEKLWVDQGHESNGVAVYGLFLGIFGMVTAWRLKKTRRPLKSLTVLAILLFLAMLFTLSAFIFVFTVTYQTTGQHIREPIASNNVGTNYPEFDWTPETWFKAVLDLPLAEGYQMADRVRHMVAWRWILLPIFLVDCVTLGITMMAWLKQRKGAAGRVESASSGEK